VLYQNVTGVDDGNGTINLVTTDQNGNRKLVYQNIGTIDYDTGVIRFSTNFNPVGGFLFTVTVEPRYSDLFVFENKIFKINRGYSDSVNVSVVSQNTRKNTL
jgi:hypothetical protein